MLCECGSRCRSALLASRLGLLSLFLWRYIVGLLSGSSAEMPGFGFRWCCGRIDGSFPMRVSMSLFYMIWWCLCEYFYLVLFIYFNPFSTWPTPPLDSNPPTTPTTHKTLPCHPDSSPTCQLLVVSASKGMPQGTQNSRRGREPSRYWSHETLSSSSGRCRNSRESLQPWRSTHLSTMSRIESPIDSNRTWYLL